jgi:hypothetical protein
MKTKLIRPVAIALALALSVLGTPASAQNSNSPAGSGSTRTDSRILYHNGPVLRGTQIVYPVWYGNWANRLNDQLILADFLSTIGSTAYFRINSGYPDSSGQAPSADLAFGGSTTDSYSHGATLTEADVADVVAQAILAGGVPLDPSGIYVVLTSPDVTLEDGATHFCQTCCDLHGESTVVGSAFRYVFVGHPERCPAGCATQFPNKVSPNGSYGADAMVAWLAHALNAVVTNPTGSGWFDRYGLENSEKCEGTYGTTYEVPGGPYGDQTAEANIRLGRRDFLIQQNWVNGKKGHCSMSYLK